MNDLVAQTPSKTQTVEARFPCLMKTDLVRPSCSITTGRRRSAALKEILIAEPRSCILKHFIRSEYQASNLSLSIRGPAHVAFFSLGGIT